MVPDLRLILAPRHPEQGDAVAAMIAARGLDFARRSLGGDASCAGAAGRYAGRDGALVSCGGHLHHRRLIRRSWQPYPWEPAAWRCAIPAWTACVANQAADYADLMRRGGGGTTAATLPGLLAGLAQDPGRQRMGRGASFAGAGGRSNRCGADSGA